MLVISVTWITKYTSIHAFRQSAGTQQSIRAVAGRWSRYAPNQRSRPVLLSAYICRAASHCSSKTPWDSDCLCPWASFKTDVAAQSSIHSDMCCCCCCCSSLRLCVFSPAYICTAWKQCSFVIMQCRSPANKQRGSINCGGWAARECLRRGGGGERGA